MKRSDTLKHSFGRFLRTMGDLMVLNWFWLLCSLPVVTMGAATCAVYAIALRVARDEEPSLVKGFFRAFRENPKPGLVLGLIALVLGVIAGVDAWFALQQTGLFQTVFLVVAFIVGAVCLIFVSYTFALQAMFDNPLKTQIKNAFALAFVAPGKTLMLWLITLFPIVLLVYLPDVAKALGALYLMMAVSGPIFLNSLILRDVFCGVVPLDPQTRLWRQKTGRLAQYLSKEASQVSRIFCGLEQRLK